MRSYAVSTVSKIWSRKRTYHELGGPTMKCTRCLSDFAFPAANPPKDEFWAYRVESERSLACGSLPDGRICIAARLNRQIA